MVFFVVRYRAPAGTTRREASPSHNTPLEITWTVIPTLLVVVHLLHGLQDLPGHGRRRRRTPTRSRSPAQKWNWLFTYPNGYVDDELHVPVDTPVRLVMTSRGRDPQLLRPRLPGQDGRGAGPLHQDLVRGRPSRASTTSVCTEYCGTEPLGHARRRSSSTSRASSTTWLEEAANFLEHACRPAEAGEMLYNAAGLQAVPLGRRHGRHRARRFQGIFGTTQPLQRRHGRRWSTRTTSASRSSSPQAKVVAGYRAGDADLPGHASRTRRSPRSSSTSRRSK